jgi:hypothetical protein
MCHDASLKNKFDETPEMPQDKTPDPAKPPNRPRFRILAL